MKKMIIPSMLVLMVSSYFLYQHFKKENFELNQMVNDPSSSETSSNNSTNNEIQKNVDVETENTNETEKSELSVSESSDSPFPTISVKKKKPVEEEDDEEEKDTDSSGLMEGISNKELNKAVKKFKEIDPELGKEIEEHVNAPEDEDLDLEDY
ncbi:hypothetical protein N9N67_05080 [Bacteriovoracaceae bacterium]|nr:hypothetical protein [Bacteriovoracaceae bacterium]